MVVCLDQDEKTRAHWSLDNNDPRVGDLPPAYDTLSLRPHSNTHAIHRASSSPLLQHIGGPSYSKPLDPTVYSLVTDPRSPVPRLEKSLPPPPKSPLDASKPFDPAVYSLVVNSKPTARQIHKSLPAPSPSKSSLDDTTPSPGESSTITVSRQKPEKRKNSSWFSFLSFPSFSCSKRARQSVLSIVSNIVNPTTLPAHGEHQNAHEVLASAAKICKEHKLSLSSILQEMFVADHTPMYWAVVNYRQELLVVLLIHAKPLTAQTISEIRRACMASSNQPLFQAMRARRPPFHHTEGIQIPGLRTDSENLLLGSQPSDDIHIQQSSNGAFVAHFEISVWQKRMRAIGQVNIQFIASSRMWSVTFFSTNPPSQTGGKSKKGAGVWHVMVTLLETSTPTFFDSQLVIDAPPRERRRGETSPRLSKRPSIALELTAGTRKLGRRSGKGDLPGAAEAPTTKPETWSDKGVNLTNAVVCPLGEGNGAELLFDNSRYLSPDGSMRGRLEVRLVKSESSKDCIIC